MNVSRPVGGLSLRRELLVVVVLAWAALAAIPLALGGIGFSWDALNHHIYLGWAADAPRFDRDFLASSYQSFTYPYLYWPAYKLLALGASGLTAGLVIVSLHVLVVPALWLAARTCIPEPGWYGSTMRGAAVLLGLSGQVFLSLLDNTANDALAATPLVWAVALALQAMPAPGEPDRWTHAGLVAWSGLLAGVSVAFKLSNGPIAIVMPLLWVLCARAVRYRVLQVFWGGVWTLAGFALAYGYWGWQLWVHFGNPMFPFFGNWFPGLPAAGG